MWYVFNNMHVYAVYVPHYIASFCLVCMYICIWKALFLQDEVFVWAKYQEDVELGIIKYSVLLGISINLTFTFYTYLK